MKRYTHQVEDLKKEWIDSITNFLKVRQLSSIKFKRSFVVKWFDNEYDNLAINITVKSVEDNGNLICVTPENDDYNLSLNDLDIYNVGYILDILIGHNFIIK